MRAPYRDSNEPGQGTRHGFAGGRTGPAVHQSGAGQLDLFADRYLCLQRARADLARGNIDHACEQYAAMGARYPGDEIVAAEAEILANLRARMDSLANATVSDRVVALVAMADELAGIMGIAAIVRKVLHERAAEEINAAWGPDAAVCGRVPGHYLMAAGALDAARESLERALERSRAAPVLFAWADLQAASGNADEARAIYLQALMCDPYAEAMDWVHDADIAALPDAARYDFDIIIEPRAWCAPVGLVTGILPRNALQGPGRETTALPARAQSDMCAGDAKRHTLESARAFVRAFHNAHAASNRDDLIAARRIMKSVQPALFRAYLEQRQNMLDY